MERTIRLVKDEPLSLTVEVQDSIKTTNHFRGMCEAYSSNQIKKTLKITTCNGMEDFDRKPPRHCLRVNKLSNLEEAAEESWNIRG